jgi:hypothetical protein
VTAPAIDCDDDVAAVLEDLAYLVELHPNDEHDGVLIGERWYPRWRLEEIAQKHRERLAHSETGGA